MPAKNESPAEDLNAREAELASRATYLAAEENKLTQQKAEIKEMLDRFEARMKANQDKKAPYCPVRDGGLVPVYFPRQIRNDKGEAVWTTDPEWVSQDHPCVKESFVPKSATGKFATDLIPTYWRPLRPGEQVPEDLPIKPASKLDKQAAHMVDLADQAPQYATIPSVKIQNGVVVKEA